MDYREHTAAGVRHGVFFARELFGNGDWGALEAGAQQ